MALTPVTSYFHSLYMVSHHGLSLLSLQHSLHLLVPPIFLALLANQCFIHQPISKPYIQKDILHQECSCWHKSLSIIWRWWAGRNQFATHGQMDHVINTKYTDLFLPRSCPFWNFNEKNSTIKCSDILPSSITEQYNFIYKNILWRNEILN